MKTSEHFHHRGTEVTQRFTGVFSLRSSARSLCLCGEKLFAFIIVLVLLTACRNAEIKPEEFASEDVCTQCKMAISEKQFAAEFFTFEGEVRKFDDIGCMVDYLKANATTKPTVFFFIDYETKKWIKGNAVTLVKSDSLVTPMYGGIVAFDDQARATAAAPKIKGKVTSLEELTKK